MTPVHYVNTLIALGEGFTTELKLTSEEIVVEVTPQVTPQVTPHVIMQATGEIPNQVGTKLALSRHQVEIMNKCVQDQAITSLMAIAGRSDRTKFRNQVLTPLLEEHLLEMTIPDKPRNSKQRYRITEKGRHILKELNRSET